MGYSGALNRTPMFPRSKQRKWGGTVAKLPAKVKRSGSVQSWAFGVERWAFPLYLEVDVDPTLVDPVRRGSFASG